MCRTAAHIDLYFVEDMVMMELNSLIDISLDYALTQCDEVTINNILMCELTLKEKRETIMKLNEVNKKTILLKIGFDLEFLNTI